VKSTSLRNKVREVGKERRETFQDIDALRKKERFYGTYSPEQGSLSQLKAAQGRRGENGELFGSAGCPKSGPEKKKMMRSGT